MRRAVSNSALSLLMTATFMWGGCISCPQFFMFPTKAKAEKSCCKKDGQCNRSTEKPSTTDAPAEEAPAKECQRMPLETRSDSLGGVHAITVELSTAVVVVSPAVLSAPEPYRETLVLDHSPPDLNVLHSTFLI